MLFDRVVNIFKAELNDFLENTKKTRNADGYDEYADIDSLYDSFVKNQPKNDWKADFEKEFEQKYGRQQHQNPPPKASPEEKAFYDALEVPQGASFEEIKASYRRLIKKYHPDKFANEPHKQKTAIELTQKLNVAYNYFEKKFGK